MRLRVGLCLGLVAMAGAALAGCADQTGVLVEVTRAEATPAPDRLVVLVGSGDETASRFADGDAGDDADVSGRDLVSDPFRVLIRPSDDMEAQLVVAALGYHGDELVGFGHLSSGVGFHAGEVRSWPIVLGPADGVDVGEGGCVRWRDEETARDLAIARPGDMDCDGYLAVDDCDDGDPAVHPGASERCGNAIDDDCDAAIDEDVDEDGDTFTTCGSGETPPDCDDWLAEVNPEAAEICDGLDNDCSGVCDDLFDGDGDGYTICGSRIIDDGSCKPVEPGYVDCNDDEAAVRPNLVEVCDGLDNDCNGVCDDGPFDRDGDGYNVCGTHAAELVSCAVRGEWIDCAPEDPAVHPAAAELCNGLDDNCDGGFATDIPCRVDLADAGCAIGFDACDESEPGEPACIGVAATDQPGPVCQVAVACQQQGVNLVECVTDLMVSDVCQFAHIDQVTCPESTVMLPTGIGECTWTLVGPIVQGGLRLSLASPGEPDEQVDDGSVVGCDARLTVTVANEADLADSRDIYVTRVDGTGVQVFHINLLIDEVSACSPPAGLECSGGIPGAPMPDPSLP